jgi:hypothetical protein
MFQNKGNGHQKRIKEHDLPSRLCQDHAYPSKPSNGSSLLSLANQSQSFVSGGALIVELGRWALFHEQQAFILDKMDDPVHPRHEKENCNCCFNMVLNTTYAKYAISGHSRIGWCLS